MRTWKPALFLSVLFSIAVITATAQSANADGFVSGTEDVPLMPGLTERDGEALVFDSPAGRIVEVLATGDAMRASVQAFYTNTLPQLGWTQTGTAQFQREGEVLTLSFPAPGTVRLKVAPQDR